MTSLKFHVQRLDSPDESFVQDASDILSSLLTQDDLTIALTGTDITLLPMLARAMIGGIVLVPGMADVFTATDDSGRLVGYIICVLPGHLLFSTEASRSHGYYAYTDNPRLDPRACEVFKKAFAQVPLETNLPAKEFQITSYWVNLAMVRAESQGQGVSTALFRLAFQRAIELGALSVGLIATNERNVAIYNAIGLQLVNQTKLQSPFNECILWHLAKKIIET